MTRYLPLTLALTACGGSAFEFAPEDKPAAGSAASSSTATVCTVALDDGGTRDYPACVGVGSVFATVSWHTGHFCDTVDLADGGTAWQTDNAYVPCAVAQPCTVVDPGAVPIDAGPDAGPFRALFYGACR